MDKEEYEKLVKVSNAVDDLPNEAYKKLKTSLIHRDRHDFNRDLINARKKIKFAKRDGQNPFYNSTYATLESVVNAITPILEEHNITYTQCPVHSNDNCLHMEIKLYHDTGHVEHFPISSIPVGKLDAHGYGAAMTYLRRFQLGAVMGIAFEDDDGNSSLKDNQQKNKNTKTKSSSSTNSTPKLDSQSIKTISELGKQCDVELATMEKAVGKKLEYWSMQQAKDVINKLQKKIKEKGENK